MMKRNKTKYILSIFLCLGFFLITHSLSCQHSFDQKTHSVSYTASEDQNHSSTGNLNQLVSTGCNTEAMLFETEKEEVNTKTFACVQSFLFSSLRIIINPIYIKQSGAILYTSCKREIAFCTFRI